MVERYLEAICIRICVLEIPSTLALMRVKRQLQCRQIPVSSDGIRSDAFVFGGGMYRYLVCGLRYTTLGLMTSPIGGIAPID